jgi:hypothetical protein
MRTQSFTINRGAVPGAGSQDIIVSWIDYSKPISLSVSSQQGGTIGSWIPSAPSWSGGQRLTPVGMSFDDGDRPYLLLSSTASAIAEDTTASPIFFSKLIPTQSTSELVILRLDYPWNRAPVYNILSSIDFDRPFLY